MSNDPRAAIAAGMQALAARDMPRAAALLREAAELAPAAEVPWVALANAELALGQRDAAEAALDRQLELAPRDFRLWVCLHEETHRVQFGAVPWLSQHLVGEILLNHRARHPPDHTRFFVLRNYLS